MSRLAAAQSGRAPVAGADAGTLLANGGFWLDSLALIELVVACEHAFGISLDEVELAREHLATVGSLARLIEARVAAHATTRPGDA